MINEQCGGNQLLPVNLDLREQSLKQSSSVIADQQDSAD